MNKESRDHFFLFQGTLVGQKLLHIKLSRWALSEQFFAVSQKNTDSLKKLFNMKIFSLKLVIKKVILNFTIVIGTWGLRPNIRKSFEL